MCSFRAVDRGVGDADAASLPEAPIGQSAGAAMAANAVLCKRLRRPIVSPLSGWGGEVVSPGGFNLDMGESFPRYGGSYVGRHPLLEQRSQRRIE